MEQVWNKCERVDNLDERQNHIESVYENLQVQVENLSYENYMIRLDIDVVHEKCEHDFDKPETVEGAVERSEKEEYENKISIFGLEEPYN